MNDIAHYTRTAPRYARRRKPLRLKINRLIVGIAIGVILTTFAIAVAGTKKQDAPNQQDIKTAVFATEVDADISKEEPTITNLLYTTIGETESVNAVVAKPKEKDIEMLAKLIWGEARGVQSTTEKAAVVWCALNRVDAAGFPNSIEAVITQPHQFVGYSADYPATAEHKALAEDVLTRWYAEKAGYTDTGRVLPKEYTFFTGDGIRNHFTDDWKSKITYAWTLPSPYEN